MSLLGFGIWDIVGRFLRRSLLAIVLATSFAQSANAAYLPSVKIGTAQLVSPSSANDYYASLLPPTDQNRSTDGLAGLTGVSPTPIPPEIVELTRALKSDPDLIYQYVRNNIQTIWMYGLQKGALGAEIDKSGTAFDQAELMMALLRQANISAKYVAGTIYFGSGGANIQQFIDWTGISNARAACQLLANGGIPATVNGVDNADCSTIGSIASVASVRMAHIWVEATVTGGTGAGCAALNQCFFDPSYKAYTWKTGIPLATAMSFTPGTPLADAKTGSYTHGTKGTGIGVPFANALNASALNTDLQGYASNLLSYIQANHLQGAQIEDIVSGGVLVPSTAVVRQAALPYADPSPPYSAHVWTPATGRFNAIPDPYRATLTVEGKANEFGPGPGGVVEAQMFDPTLLYADEIYGRRLTVETDFTVAGIGVENDYFKQQTCLALDAQHWSSWPAAQCLQLFSYVPTGTYLGQNPRGLGGRIILSANHPYAASKDDGSGTGGDYMDVSGVSKTVMLITPLTIVHSWGDVSPNLFAKWSDERASDEVLPVLNGAPYCPGSGHDLCVQQYLKPNGGFQREKTAATWLAQFSRAARLNAAIANTVPQLHHTLGVVFGDAKMQGVVTSPTNDPGYLIADNFDRIDVDAGVSFTSKDSASTAPAKRRGALMAFAAASATLEGSMAAQQADLPDTSSTATRFEWGNAPDTDHSSTGQNPFGIGAQDFYQYNNTTASQVTTLSAVDGGATGSCSGTGTDAWSAPPQIAPGTCTTLIGSLSTWVGSYTAAGFDVVTSREAFLGPGQRGGMIIPGTPGGINPVDYTHDLTEQRGGALVALKVDGNGDPLEIAHIIIDGKGVNKGGGGGTQPDSKTSYDPATAADILKSRFVDRSGLLGVNLSNGALNMTSPVSIGIGNGGFPYELSASLSWHAATPPSPWGPVSPVAPQAGWSHSWLNGLTLSGSGMEAMGASDIRAAAGAIASYYATQDIYQATYAPEREAAALLTQAWWSHQLTGNVATVNVGGNAKQFVKLATGTWISPGPGTATTLVQSGTRSPYEEKCFHVLNSDPPYALSRGWNTSGLSFTVTNPQGDAQTFGYFDNGFHTDEQRICGHLKGFRLTNWTFPYGMTVTPTYTLGDPNADTFDTLTSIANNIGRSLSFTPTRISASAIRHIDMSDATAQPLSMTDAMSKTTSFTYQPAQAASTTQRPVPYALLASMTTPESALHNTDWNYDGLGRIEAVYDAVAIKTPAARGPYNFYLADATRGERDDPLGQAYSVVYDSYGHPSRYIDEMGIETDTLIDSRSRTVNTIYPEGDCEAFAYDDRNNTTDLWKVDKTSACNTGVGSSHVLHASATWDSTWNKPLTVTNFRNKTTTLTYYGSGSGASLLHTATRPTVPEGTPVYTFAYDAKGKATDLTGPTTPAIVTHNGYDGSENLTSTVVDYNVGSGHLNLTTGYGYDSDGNVTSTTDPRGNVTTSQFDLERRKTEDDHHDGNAAAPLNSASKTIYDEIGRVTDNQVGTAFSGTITWLTTKHTTYTPTSKVATIIDADSRVTTTTYDDADRTRKVTDPIGRNTLFQYCASGNTDCAANQVKTEYRGWQSGTACSVTGTDQECYRRVTFWPDGEQKTIKDANGNTTNFTYDGFNRLYQTAFPDTTTETIPLSGGYDENGNVLQHTNRAGTTLTYTYDDLDQIRIKSMPVLPSGTIDTTWTYLLDGRIDTLSDTTSASMDYGYDTAGRMTQVINHINGFGADRTVNYTLDANGNRTKLTWPTNDVSNYYVGYCYDSLNRMTAAMENSTSSGCATNLLATYLYDAQSRRTNVTYAGTGAQMQYTSYSDAGDLKTLVHDLNGTSNDNTFNWLYTNAHQTNSFDATNTNWLWRPGTNNSTSYTINNLNQYPTVGSQTTGGTNCQGAAQGLSYDCNGNLTFDGTYTFTYDAENRLLTVSKSGLAATYAYDPLGRRTKKSGTGVTTTYYLSDGADEIAEYDSTKAVVTRIIPGPAVDEPIAIQTVSTGAKEFFHTDKQGSVVAMTDTSGNLAEGPYIYDAYGNCFSSGSACSSSDEPYRFTGRRLDTETGCLYYRARYYCPDDKRGGRFLQTDPVGYIADLNLYTYGNNDPMDRTDPNGTCPPNLHGCGADFSGLQGFDVSDTGVNSTAGITVTPNIGSLRNDATGEQVSSLGIGRALSGSSPHSRNVVRFAEVSGRKPPGGGHPWGACHIALETCEAHAHKIWDAGDQIKGRQWYAECVSAARDCEIAEKRVQSDPEIGRALTYFPPRPSMNPVDLVTHTGPKVYHEKGKPPEYIPPLDPNY